MPGPERQARDKIDQWLKDAGWRVVPYTRWHAGDRTRADAIEEYPTDSGPGDYLLMLDGQPDADVEAKKQEISPENVVEQAKRYSRALHDSPFRSGEYRLPFVNSTNGTLIYTSDLRDVLHYTRQIAHFHTPDALRDYLAHDLSQADLWLRTHPINQPDRSYQPAAIAAIGNAIRHAQDAHSDRVVTLAQLAKQRRIVAKIEALFAQADAIEEAVNIARQRAEKVDQAVLAQAFRGEL